jgi:Domain of unknown function (DUF4911)
MERVKRFMMTRKGIGFFKAILESYEEVGLMTVLDGRSGFIEVTYPSTVEADLEGIMKDLERFDIVFTEAGDV